jgi:hypothetical protein
VDSKRYESYKGENIDLLAQSLKDHLNKKKEEYAE